MNAGGAAGLLASGILSLIFSDNDIYDERVHGVMAIVVTSAGLAGGAAAGRMFDQNRGAGQLSRRRIHWTAPMPLVSPQPDGTWTVQLRLDGVRF